MLRCRLLSQVARTKPNFQRNDICQTDILPSKLHCRICPRRTRRRRIQRKSLCRIFSSIVCPSCLCLRICSFRKYSTLGARRHWSTLWICFLGDRCFFPLLPVLRDLILSVALCFLPVRVRLRCCRQGVTFSGAPNLFAAIEGVFVAVVAAITRFTARIASISAARLAAAILIFFSIFNPHSLSGGFGMLLI